ncbi:MULTISPECIES: hypothetical protein [unclassified Dysgonomonas]|uniref:hypothetical protein n=1 Tax=unclassified Dysgonomonas TaxID=2630389 RepID=UPI0013ECE91A|nr:MULTISPECIES: hypothetical protein [unclassified Dysgonomonas]
MKTDDTLKKSGSIVYKVDPERLSISSFNISQINVEDTTTTYENFSMECTSSKLELNLDRLPAKIKGIMYFKTKDEARDFIKSQIGM